MGGTYVPNYRIGKARLLDGKSITQNTTNYSDSMKFEFCSGEVAMLVKSSAGSITVTQQCSIDGNSWFDPIDSAGSAAGAVGSALTSISGGQYITFTPVLCNYIRFKIVENNTASTDVTLDLLFQE